MKAAWRSPGTITRFRCFASNGASKPGEKNDLYLFMADRSVIPGAPAPGKPPEFKQVSDFMTMTWAVGDKVYLLAGMGDEAALKKYLE